MAGRRASATVGSAGVVSALAMSLGKLWRVYRRRLPRNLQEPFLDLLLECRFALQPQAGRSTAATLKEARSEVACLAELCKSIALRQCEVSECEGEQNVRVADVEELSCGDSAQDFLSVCDEAEGSDCTDVVKFQSPVNYAEMVAQTELSFALHDAASVVANTPIEAVFVGQAWQAREAITRHAACIEEVGLQLLGIEEYSVDITGCGGVGFVREPCFDVGLPSAARLSAMEVMLRHKVHFAVYMQAFFGWKTLSCLQGGQKSCLLRVGGWTESYPRAIGEGFERLECRAALSSLGAALEGEDRLELFDDMVELLVLNGFSLLVQAAFPRLEAILQDPTLAQLIADRSFSVLDAIKEG